MKLARPDVFHPRIALASCAQLLDGDGDDAGLIPALARRGLSARWLSWDDPQILTCDLVILRATWDYHLRLPEFLAWTAQVPHLLNAPEVVAWNVDKTYLRDLARAGVPVLDSDFFAPGKTVHLPGGELVVKPAVGAGSLGARRFTDRSAARDHAAALQESGQTVLVQPYDARVADGETALVFVSGQRSHAFIKGPMLAEPGRAAEFDESGAYAKEVLRPADPDVELWDLGYAALAAAAQHLGMAPSELLYARVDVIGDRHDPRLLELELVEPSLGWRQVAAAERADAQRQFALAVESALERFGLGPWAGRRP